MQQASRAHDAVVRPMSVRTLEECPGCGLVAARFDDGAYTSAAHFGASASCWAAFSEVLQREYHSRRLFLEVHPLTLDAYAAQHPVELDASLAAHLIRLYSVFELGYDTVSASSRVRRFTRRGRDYDVVDPPSTYCDLTVAHALWATSELDHVRRVWEWAEAVWKCWAPHHVEIARWVRRGP
jgi:hypothetical protein